MNPVNVDLETLQQIMDKLPDPPPGGMQRKNALTKDDIMIIAEVVAAVGHGKCAMGFTADEISTIKKLVKTLNGSILAIGYAFLAAIGAGLFALIGWAVKHGIVEAAGKTVK